MVGVLIVEEKAVGDGNPAPAFRRWPLAVACIIGPFVVILVLFTFYSQLISPALYQDSAKLVFHYAPAAPDETAAKPGATTVTPDPTMFLPARDYAGHVAYAIASAFLALAALGTLVFSAALVHRSWKWPGVIAAVLIWTGVAWVVSRCFTNVHGRYLVVRDLLNDADSFPGLAAFVTTTHGRPLPTGQLMETLIFANTFIALIPIGMLLTALFLLTRSPPQPLSEITLGARRLLLRCLLWFASASFVMGVLCNKALVEWPLTLIKASQAIALTPIADSLVLQFGALGTAAILAAFAPAIAAWMLDVDFFRRTAQAAGGKNAMVPDTLQFAPVSTITSILAVIAPLLASPAVDSVRSILGALSK